jgi:histidine triad (HIT) family protein
VAKLVDARDSKSRGGDTVSVRVRPSAPSFQTSSILRRKDLVSDPSCIFCKIIQGTVKSKIIREDEYTITIEDIAPKAPIHYLIIPKKHLISMVSLQDEDVQLGWYMMLVVRDLGLSVAPNQAFNIVSNNGAAAGQSVPHLHWHFLAGKNIYSSGFSL